MTRGVLIDVAALKGVEMLPDTYEITVEDLQQALQRQNLTLQPGDAVIVHTGWGTVVGQGQRALHEDQSRPRRRRRRVAGAQDPMLVGADNGPVEVTPNPDPNLATRSIRSCWSSTASICWRT